MNTGKSRADLANIIESDHRDERLRDIVLHAKVRDLLFRLISENRSWARLERFGVSPRHWFCSVSNHNLEI